MFARLAEFVARRHKAIIIAWVVALLMALPLAPLVGTVVQYDETRGAPESLESTAANDLIAQRFGDSSIQPTTIIVLASGNILDEESKRVVTTVDRELRNASLDGRLHKVSVTTVYGVVETYTLNVLVGLNAAYTGANLTSYVIYGLPQDYRALWQEVNQSTQTFFVVPRDHARTWELINLTNPGRSVSEVDALTYEAMRDALSASSGGLTPERRSVLFGWYDAFAAAWSGNASLAYNATLRAAHARDGAFPGFVGSLPIDAGERALLFMLNETFATRDVTFANVGAFTQQAFASDLEARMGNVSSAQRELVHDYLNATCAWWSALPGEPSLSAFESGVSSVAQAFGPSVKDPTVRSLFLSLHQSLGFARFNDLEARRAVIGSLVASTPSVAQQVAPQPWVVVAAGDLGANYSTSSMVALSKRIVANSSLGGSSFPLKVPADLVALLVSPSNTTMLVTLTYDPVDGDLDPGKADVGEVREIVAAAVSGTGVEAYVTGSDPIGIDLQEATYRDLEIIEPVTIVLILVLIGLYFRSFVASSVPPLAVGLALGISYALVYVVGSFVMAIHYSVLTLLLTSMMGAGCDYCIFILSRYREERKNGHDKEESVRRAVTWAGESIATSGATVIIGFGVLSLGRFNMMQSIGVALAMGVTVALLVALTLLPSLLILLGDRMFWPARMGRPVKARSGPGYFTKSAEFAIRHAKVIVVVAVVISVPTTYLVYSMQTSYDFIGSMAESESKRGLNALQDGFGGGKVTPTLIAVELSSPVAIGGSIDATKLAPIENVSAGIAGLGNVKQVVGPTRPNGVPIDYTNTTVLERYQTAIHRMVSQDGRSVLLTVVFVAEPYNKASIASIQDIRNIAEEARGGEITRLYVGGATASMYDISSMVQSDFGNIEYLVVIGIYVVLLVVLGSVVSPLKSILTILLSISWTLAATLILFQVVLGQPVLYMVPMILFVVCLGLGMDYDILLITRIREEVTKGRDDHDSIVRAMESTGGIITACGIIMAAAFGSMMLSNGFLLKEFGFALMFAILLDATVVRIYLVPAIMSLLGKWNWWAPGPLRRIGGRRGEGGPEGREKDGGGQSQETTGR